MPRHELIKRSFCLCCVIACLVLIVPERRTLEARVGSTINEDAIVSTQEPASVSKPTICCKTFVRYQPSELELSWKKTISKIRSNRVGWEEGCNKVRQEIGAHKRAVSGIQEHAARKIRQAYSSELSSMLYVDNCTGNEMTVPIEPLVSFLRHPLALVTARKKFGGIT